MSSLRHRVGKTTRHEEKHRPCPYVVEGYRSRQPLTSKIFAESIPQRPRDRCEAREPCVRVADGVPAIDRDYRPAERALPSLSIGGTAVAEPARSLGRTVASTSEHCIVFEVHR